MTTPVAVLRPTHLRRWPEGDVNMQWLACITCPYCKEEHCHSVSVLAVVNEHTWTCRAVPLGPPGRYRLAVFAALSEMWDAVAA